MSVTGKFKVSADLITLSTMLQQLGHRDYLSWGSLPVYLQGGLFGFLGAYMEIDHNNALQSVRSSFFLETGAKATMELKANIEFGEGLPSWFPSKARLECNVKFEGRTPEVDGFLPPPIAQTKYAGGVLDVRGNDFRERRRRALEYNRINSGWDKVRWHTVEFALDIAPDNGFMRAVINMEKVLTSPEFRDAAYNIAMSVKSVLGALKGDSASDAVTKMRECFADTAASIRTMVTNLKQQLSTPEWKQDVQAELNKVRCGSLTGM